MAGVFWGNKETDPKRKFRWVVLFTGGASAGDGNVIQLAAKSIDKPKFEISTTEHMFINHTYNFPGRGKWNEISTTLVDIGGDRDVTSIINSLILGSGYATPDDPASSLQSITKEQSVDIFGANFQIQQIDAEGVVVEAWKLFNPWVRNVEFGSLDYTSEELVEISLTIVYDYAKKVV
jgi:hypothetical protein